VSETDFPIIGITMGDPAGIGPEICVKAAVSDEVRQACIPLIIGNIEVLRATADDLGSGIKFSTEDDFDAVRVVNAHDLPNVKAGIESAVTGRAAAKSIELAVQLWNDRKIDAIATAPISKNALAMAGYEFPGHTEFLAHLTGSKRVGMSFFGGDLRVVLLSTHLSLKDAIEKVKKRALAELIVFASEELEKLVGRKPKLAVAGLNPHASENGMFGTEEQDEIVPAVEECAEKHNIDVSGPYSPDTIFLRGYRGEFDAVIALYHDQATIAVKCLAFGSAVNVTLGLPLIRTSVDHGTAFDIAGRGVADASSMVAAIKLASDLVRTKET